MIPIWRVFWFSFTLLLLTPLIVKGEIEDNEIINPKLKNLEVNIVTYLNGVGIEQDFYILETELKKYGYIVRYISNKDLIPPPHADINIFIQSCKPFFLPFADKNYFIPNPEYCSISDDMIAQFDSVLCRTRECERIFKPLNPNTEYIGFTCKDRYVETIEKNYRSFIHLAGASVFKNTETVFEIWKSNPQLPQLTLIKHRKIQDYSPLSNLNFIGEYLSEEKLLDFQNSCGVHLCPSLTEGFGHYIMEALSTGAVVVTTNAPPMNEFVFDPRCLVDYDHAEPKLRATRYFVNPFEFQKVIHNLMCLSEKELKKIGKKNRKLYLENDRLFKKRFAEIFDPNGQTKRRNDNS